MSTARAADLGGSWEGGGQWGWAAVPGAVELEGAVESGGALELEGALELKGAVELGGEGGRLWSSGGLWRAQGGALELGEAVELGGAMPASAQVLMEVSAAPQVFMEELNRKQPDVEKVTKSCKRKLAVDLGPPATRRLATREDPHHLSSTLRGPPSAPSSPSPQVAAAAGRRMARRCRSGLWSPRPRSWRSSCTAGSSSGCWPWTGSTGWRRRCSACGR